MVVYNAIVEEDSAEVSNLTFAAMEAARGFLLLRNGDFLLLRSGDRLLTFGTPRTRDYLKLRDPNDRLLLRGTDLLLLRGEPEFITVSPSKARHLHRTTEPDLTYNPIGSISPFDVTHVHRTTQPTITHTPPMDTIVPAFVRHGHTTTVPTLVHNPRIEIDNARHVHRTSQTNFDFRGGSVRFRPVTATTNLTYEVHI